MTSFRDGGIVAGAILVIVLLVLLIGALPSWSYSRNWGYGPAGGVGLIVVIVVILALLGSG
ncbi:DUF3309 family protein [Ralstonia solanacearum]|uniref:Transmembrane protein n=1 Tax=Ralstonia solanacearum CFBP2957 TaxID=859656 RepID=D8P3Q2_RALSL|nr:conserved protein of unknown function [Ralstonia solanacearum CFBP2957]